MNRLVAAGPHQHQPELEEHSPPTKPAPATMHRSDTASLHSIRAEHYKKRADDAVKKGNFRQARELYTQSMRFSKDVAIRKKVLIDRSHACVRAMRYEDALKDAEEAIAISPKWHVAHFQKGVVLLEMKLAPKAARSFAHACNLSPDEGEHTRNLRRSVDALTQEEVGDEILETIRAAERAGDIPEMQHEGAPIEELREAAYKAVNQAEKFKPSFPDYRTMLGQWMRKNAARHALLSERSALLNSTGCHIQARLDARLAVEELNNIQDKMGISDLGIMRDLCLGWARLGDAYALDSSHPDSDIREAIKWYTLCVDRSPEKIDEFDRRLAEAGRILPGPELDKVLMDVHNIGGDKGPFRGNLSVVFRKAKVCDFDHKSRKDFREAIANKANVPSSKISIERVRSVSRASRSSGLEVQLQIDFGQEEHAARSFLKSIQDDPRALWVQERDVFSAIEIGTAGATFIDSSKAKTKQSSSTRDRADEKSIVIRRSRKELALPYKYYCLVHADGRRVERQEKHPFCMSRVFYDAKDVAEEIWVQMSDGSCRWRQSSSEVKVIALQVPSPTKASELNVAFDPYFIKVQHNATGEIFLEGDLERGIIPEDCTWTHGQGGGEDGCVLYLKKMNLELIVNPNMHSEMWWPRLMADHPMICWDDYEKDYSDLPADILGEHRAKEETEDEVKRLEHMEKHARHILQERDDKRKRRRQEMLHKMRTGRCVDWVNFNMCTSTSQRVHTPKS